MAIGDTPNQNLFGTNYNAENEEQKKALLAAQNAMMGAGSPTGMGAATPASTFGQAPATNSFSFQPFKDPSFNTPNFDAIPQTPTQERTLQIYGQEELNEKNRDAFISGMVGQREGFEKPMSFPELERARYKAEVQDFSNRYMAGEFGRSLNDRADNLTSAISRANRDLNKFTNTFAQPNSPQANFLTRMETGQALSPQEIQDASALAASMGTTFDPKTGYSREAFGEARNAELNPPMTGLRPVNPQSGEFLSQDVIAAGEGAGLTFPSQVSLPMPQAPQAPQVQAPMGQEETRAALGGMTLNEYLNAPAGTEGVSGLQTDPQGRMITPSAQPPVDSAVAPATAQPPVAALSSFEKDSLARQQRIGGTGSFEGDSQAMQARLAARPDFNEAVSDRDRRAARGDDISMADQTDMAKANARGASPREVARGNQVANAFGVDLRTGQPLQQGLTFEQQLAQDKFNADQRQNEATAQSKQAVSELELADQNSFNTSITGSTSPEGVVNYNQALNEYVRGGGSNKGYLEFLRKGQELEQKAIDAGRTPKLESVIIGDPNTGFRALIQDGKIMQATTIRSQDDDPSVIQTRDANIELLTLARKDYLSGDPERMARAKIQVLAANMKGEFGAQLTAKDLFKPDANNNPNPSDPNSQVTDGGLTQQEENIQKVIAANPGSKRAEVIEAMQKKGKL